MQIGPPVVPEQRSGGRQPPRTCCLFTATPSAHKTGKSQDVSAPQGDKRGRGVGPGGQAGPGRNSSSGGGSSLPGLAKEVKLTSLKIFFSAYIFFFFLSLSLSLHIAPHGEGDAQDESWCVYPASRCRVVILNPHSGTRSFERQCSFFFFFFFWSPSAARWRCPAVYCNQPSDTLPCFHITTHSSRSPPRPSTLRVYLCLLSVLCVDVERDPCERCWVFFYSCSRDAGVGFGTDGPWDGWFWFVCVCPCAFMWVCCCCYVDVCWCDKLLEAASFWFDSPWPMVPPSSLSLSLSDVWAAACVCVRACLCWCSRNRNSE